MKRIEVTANVLIIGVAILAAIVFAQNLVGGSNEKAASGAAPVAPGSRISLQGVNWKENGRTVLLALSKGCHFCSDSAPFYRRLVEELEKRDSVKLIALFPHSVGEGTEYLESLGVVIRDLRQEQLDLLGVKGTPTIILLNDEGIVTRSWVGRLSPERETEVLDSLGQGASAGA
jgi:hypothetical protein